ncbi:hypothetical protein ACHAWO_012213 [Cyclotella atomus]|uniref:RING-type domain-containing protein n=1 Tax=Cyclotella atomus TaxID=382360 RepID=A0ABD3NIM0_9STRA
MIFFVTSFRQARTLCLCHDAVQINQASHQEAAWTGWGALQAINPKSSTEMALLCGSSASTRPDADDEGCSCHCCGVQICNTDDRVKLMPCKHLLCTLCALESQIIRRHQCQICPVDGCDKPTTSNKYIGARDGLVRSFSTAVKEEDMKNDTPTEWLINHHKPEIKAADQHNQAFVMSASMAEMNEEGELCIHTITSSFVLKVNHNKKKSDSDEVSYSVVNPMQALVEIGAFFSFLHVITKASVSHQRHLPVLSPKELMELRCRSPRLIDRALFAFGTGNAEFDPEIYFTRDNQDHQRFYLSAIVAADSIMRNLRNHPGYLQLMMNELLHRQKVSREFHDHMSRWGLSASRKYDLSARLTEAVNQMANEVIALPRDLPVAFFDNIGFIVPGRHAGYDQYTLVDIVVLTEAELKAVGFYNDENPDGRISREHAVNWADEKRALSYQEKMALVTKILSPSSEEWERFSASILENIKYVIDYMSQLTDREATHRLPRFDRIVDEVSRTEMEALQQNGYSSIASRTESNSSRQRNSFVLPRNHIPEDAVEDEVLLRPVEGSNINNRYKQNNSHVHVEHYDLSQASTVEAIILKQTELCDKLVQQWNEKVEQNPQLSTAEPPLAEHIIALGCDGQPASAARKIVQDNLRHGWGYPSDKIWVSHGGLHTVMKTLNAHGDLFYDLLNDVYSAIRDTLDKRLWILNKISDPRQAESDRSWALLAGYAVAASNLKIDLERDLSPVEVNEFMLERARQYPFCAFALLEMRMVAVAKLMRNAESKGNHGEGKGNHGEAVEYFFTAIKLALPLFAVTHKTDYVYLTQELLKQWHCASPAQRLVYGRYILTRKSSTGLSIFGDFLVELQVMDFRGDLGKVHRKGHDLAMQLLARELPNRPARSNFAHELDDPDASSTAARSSPLDA